VETYQHLQTTKETNMGWSIKVTGDSLPDPQEIISSVSSADGNFYTAVMKMKDKQLREMDTDEAVTALMDLIVTLDKGDNGLFSDEWCKEADNKWSRGVETMTEYSKWIDIFGSRGIPPQMPFHDYVSFCGYTTRERMRNDAMRFFLYYKTGYTVTYEW
jgi:hypothetical protein